MDDDDSDLHPDDDTADVLRKLISGIQTGAIQQFTLRAKLKDGTVQDIQFGYDSDEERDAALARLLKLIGELH